MKTSKEIRNGFAQYFAERDHTIVESSSLVPADDRTLLFTNAGMVQFKDIFLGQKKAPYLRATSSQRCIRVGGKHNDLENVGYTARHHTFFEMLGNFSFGDYFKREAIAYCWEFIHQSLHLPTERLWVTVYEEDDESVEFWVKDTDIARDRILRLGKDDNFWSIGDIGPCGPCTEVYYDHGEGVPGGLPGSDDEGDRYTEIWNLVFMQYQKNGDEMTKLRAPSVDTGMGLERISAVMQGVTNNYDTDLFQPLIRATADLAGAGDDRMASLRIIADHVRACAFLIADDVHPDNEGRGYVLRRIIRRAARHGNKIGLRDPFMHSLLDVLMDTMGEDFPRLTQASDRIRDTLTAEEKRFADTLEQGLAILENCLSDLSGDKIPGDVAFKLYDTYGFPVDLTSDIARENGLQVDLPAFEACMREQRNRTRGAKTFSLSDDALLTGDEATEFSGYEQYDGATEVERIIADGREVESAAAGEDVVVILQRTPFYAESGGQVGDTGELTGANGEDLMVRVTDTLKQSDVHKHCGTVERGMLKTGMKLNARVDIARRRAICLNHSATHLLHAALRRRLGEHVTQKGSLVAADRLRFDFSHDKPLSREEIRDIEHEVNEQIRLNNEATIEIMPRERALDSGAMSLFGEKYGDEVRVLSFGDYSVELCGGTHVERTGDIGLFHIVLETGIAMGVRRIEAITGHVAEERVNEYRALLREACDALKSEPEHLLARIEQLAHNKADLEKRVDEYQARLSSGDGGLADQIVRVDDCAVLAARIDNIDRKALRAAVDQWRDKIKSGVIVLATVNDGKINLIAGVTADYVERIHAGKLVNAVAELIGGKGGGRNPAMAEAGGKDIDALDAVLKQVPDRVREQMADAPQA